MATASYHHGNLRHALLEHAVELARAGGPDAHPEPGDGVDAGLTAPQQAFGISAELHLNGLRLRKGSLRRIS